MQKLCMLFLMVITNSVAGQEILPTVINFNIKAGQYEEFQALTWKPKDTICIATTLVSPNKGSEWWTLAGVTFLGEKEGEYASIQLIDNRSESQKPSLFYTTSVGGKENKFLIRENVEYGQRIIYELRFSRSNEFDIYIDGGVGQLKSPFEFLKLKLGATSAKSIVEFNTASCSQKN